MTDFTSHDARQLADREHDLAGDRYGDGPYVVHLDEVVRILAQFGFGHEFAAQAGYLHDIVEDTAMTADGLRERGVSELVVLAVLFLSDEEGHNRKTRKANTYARVKQDKIKGGEATRLGIPVKWADRIANVRQSKADNPGLFKMYRKEAVAFRAAYMPIDSLLADPGFLRMVAAYDLLVTR